MWQVVGTSARQKSPPSTTTARHQPSDDGTEIVWDGGKKFYGYEEWIRYIAEKILEPQGFSISGIVHWQGEDPDDSGDLIVTHNKVMARPAPAQRKVDADQFKELT